MGIRAFRSGLVLLAWEAIGGIPGTSVGVDRVSDLRVGSEVWAVSPVRYHWVYRDTPGRGVFRRESFACLYYSNDQGKRRTRYGGHYIYRMTLI